MAREELQTASEEIERASELTSNAETSQRLQDQSAQMVRLATQERGPDHGRLARHERILSTIQSEADDDVAAHIDTALTHIRSYRETIEGV